MRFLSFLAKVAVFLMLLGFAVKNMEGVTVRYFSGLEWQAPLAFVALVIFSAGVLAGILTNLAVIVRQRRELLALKRELSARGRAAVAIPVEAI